MEAMTKVCKKCGTEYPLTEFYKHKLTLDGYMGSCKKCGTAQRKNREKADVEKYRANNKLRYEKRKGQPRKKYPLTENGLRYKIEYMREYNKRPEVKERNRKHLESEKGRKTSVNSVKKRNSRFPFVYKAHRAVKKSLSKKELAKKPCIVCQSHDSHAHHEDYTKPLDVIWYCKKHHMDRHKEMRDAGFVWDELGRPVLKEK